MKSRLVIIENGKDPANCSKATHYKVLLPMRVLKFLLLFLVLGLGFSMVSMYRTKYLGVRSIVHAAASTFTPCPEEPNALERFIRPPSRLWHTLKDNELLWRASFTTQMNNYPFKRTPKIAFMFLTKGPLPLAPLWERFFKGHEGLYSIYVHSLPSYTPSFTTSSVFYSRHIPSEVTEWGKMSMCDAERRLLGNALLDISNEWFILLSESCIPLLNFSIAYHYISKSRHSFMASADEPGPYGRGRYNPKMSPGVNLSDWRKGSQWFEVNRGIAVQIVQDTFFYPKFKDFCQPGCYVDEHYFQTMLSIKVPHLLANRSLTWVDWSRGGAHPGRFGKGDMKKDFFKKIFEGHTCTYNNQPSSFCFLFARKFAPNALEPLLKLAYEVFGF